MLLFLLLCGCATQLSFPAGFENASGQTLLAEGLSRHEQGNFAEALEFFDAAYRMFERQNDKYMMAEVLSARSLTLRRLDRLEEALIDLQNAVKMTEGKGGVVLPLYNLAKVQQEIGSSDCVETYRQALDAMNEYRPAPHYRQAVIHDMQIHLSLARLEFGMDDGTSEGSVIAAISALMQDPELDPFGRMVWVSGGYIGLTRYYISIDSAKAWRYFNQAEAIVYEYPDQTVLRRQDIDALRAEMPPKLEN